MEGKLTISHSDKGIVNGEATAEVAQKSVFSSHREESRNAIRNITTYAPFDNMMIHTTRLVPRQDADEVDDFARDAQLLLGDLRHLAQHVHLRAPADQRHVRSLFGEREKVMRRAWHAWP